MLDTIKRWFDRGSVRARRAKGERMLRKLRLAHANGKRTGLHAGFLQGLAEGRTLGAMLALRALLKSGVFAKEPLVERKFQDYLEKAESGELEDGETLALGDFLIVPPDGLVRTSTEEARAALGPPPEKVQGADGTVYEHPEHGLTCHVGGCTLEVETGDEGTSFYRVVACPMLRPTTSTKESGAAPAAAQEENG